MRSASALADAMMSWASRSALAWRDLYFYWRDRHVDGRPPSRADIDPPLDVPKLLPNLIIYDRVDGDFRVRLAGSEVVRRGGRDATGRKLTQDMATYEGMITLIESTSRNRQRPGNVAIHHAVPM